MKREKFVTFWPEKKQWSMNSCMIHTVWKRKKSRKLWNLFELINFLWCCQLCYIMWRRTLFGSCPFPIVVRISRGILSDVRILSGFSVRCPYFWILSVGFFSDKNFSGVRFFGLCYCNFLSTWSLKWQAKMGILLAVTYCIRKRMLLITVRF